jgi:hypothetical protein
MVLPVFNSWQGNFQSAVAASIASGQQISSTIELEGYSFCGVFLPAAFTGTALTFEASYDGTNFFPVYNTTSGTALSYTVAQGHYCAIDPKDFYGINYLQIKSGSAEAAARTLQVSLKGF